MDKNILFYFILVFTTIFLDNTSARNTRIYINRVVDFELADAVRTDVTYHLFNRNYPDGIYLTEENIEEIDMNRDTPTKVAIHGWLSNETTYWYGPLRDAYFQRGDYNVIYIDWSKAGSKTYPVSAANTKPVGEFIADFLLLAELTDIHVIGHSLGSHVAGFVGKYYKEKIGFKVNRITGTDPAGVLFEAMPEDSRIHRTDAEFVDIVHTDDGHYGFGYDIGSVDFYPNGGSNQPGCPPLDEDDNCSHARSNLYFIESINSAGFRATECESWEDYVGGNCSGNDVIVFGEDVPRDIGRGKFYFKTNSEPPFALNMNERKCI